MEETDFTGTGWTKCKIKMPECIPVIRAALDKRSGAKGKQLKKEA
jgi:hypothetical protein